MQINENWEYQQFDTLFDWCEKSKIKSGAGKQNGKYKMFVCSDTDVKYYDEYLQDSEALVFGTGGKASCHYVNGKFAYSTDCIVAVKNSNELLPKFYFYFLRQQNMKLIQETFTGSGLEHTSKKKIGQLLVPVPPLPEQQRIVAKIEELFAELDNSVAMLKKVKEQLEVYRQAVLEKAFEIADESVLLREYIEKPTYGTSQKCTYDKKKNSIAVYRIPNISDYGGHIDHSDLKYAVFSNEDKAKYVLKENDILIIRSNGSEDVVGQVALVRNKDINGLFAGYLIRLRIKQNVSLCAKYLFYFLQSFKARKYIVSTAKSTNGINNINAEEIQNISIPICEHEKQIEAVTFIENNLSLCRQLNKNISVGLQQADALRQSILKKAFEGEL